MSTLRYSVRSREEVLRETLERNKRQYSEQMMKSIQAIAKSVEKLAGKLRLASELMAKLNEAVKVLENEKNQFLRDYTIAVLDSPNHDRWVRERLDRFNELLASFQRLFDLLDIEMASLDRTAYDNIQKAIPSELGEFKAEFEALRTYFDNADKLLKDQNVRKEELEKLLNETPAILSYLRNEISRALLRMELKNQRTGKAPAQQASSKTGKMNEEEEIEKLKETAKKYYDKLDSINKAQASSLYKFMVELEDLTDINRVRAITEQVKLTYIKAKEELLSNSQKERILSAAREFNNPQVLQLAQQIVQREVVRDEDYIEFMQKAYEISLKNTESEDDAEIKRKVIDLVNTQLSANGYKALDENLIESLNNGDVVELATPFGEDYALRLKIDEEGNIAVRFVKYVEEPEQIIEYEKHKDISIAKRWCETYDEMLRFLEMNGLKFVDKHRVEPEEKIYYEKRSSRESARHVSKANQNLKAQRKYEE